MATTRKQGRPKSEEKYHLILHAASCLFLKEGFANTSMDTVAKASGVSKQTVYSHFEGKDALFKAIALLPETIETLSALWDDQDYNGLKTEVHKLHGACCYTGLPRMQHLANETESSLKLGQHKLVEENLPALIAEAKKVLNESKLRDSRS